MKTALALNSLCISSTVFVAKKAKIKTVVSQLNLKFDEFQNTHRQGIGFSWKKFYFESLVEWQRKHCNDTYSFRQSSTRLSSLDSSSSIKLLTCQIGIVRIQMEMLMRVSTVNSNLVVFFHAHWFALPQSHTWNAQELKIGRCLWCRQSYYNMRVSIQVVCKMFICAYFDFLAWQQLFTFFVACICVPTKGTIYIIWCRQSAGKAIIRIRISGNANE